MAAFEAVMISVVVQTFNDGARLVRCLAPMVTASMEGLVREVVIVDAGSTDETLEIADDAGAKILKTDEGLSAGLKAAKGPWVLVLDPGVRLETGWEAAVRHHMADSRRPARFRLAHADAGWLAGLFPPKALAVLALKEAYSRGGGLDPHGRGLRGAHRVRLLDAGGRVHAVKVHGDARGAEGKGV